MKRIAITGFSGRLPESSNVNEFWRNLQDGVDMVTEDERRWPLGIYDLPLSNGKLKDITHFDASFFNIHAKQATAMDPQLRLLLEVVYEAIMDSGFTINEMSGTKTAVYVGCIHSDNHHNITTDATSINGYEMTGNARTMMANRISYSFNFQGPSLAVDTACSSSLEALNLAYHALLDGSCENAIVAGSHLLLRPESSVQFNKLHMLSPDGRCKSFDDSANGYVRSEGIIALFLQNYKDARRIYSSVLGSLDNCDGQKELGITFPSGNVQSNLLRDVYRQANIDPLKVSYIEAHGTGTQAGDPQELKALDKVFCDKRESPLLVGSVKSNMGHCEPAAGLASLVKLILAHEHRLLPGNLNYKQPNRNIESLISERIKVVDRLTPWEGGIVGINSFGFGGANVHSILNFDATEGVIDNLSDRPTVGLVCARTKEGVENLLNLFENNTNNLGLQFLCYNQRKESSNLLPFRGFITLNTPSTLKGIQKFTEPDTKRPIYYVYPGMGCQWVGMGRDMMTFDCFRNSIETCSKALMNVGMDLKRLLEKGTEDDFKNPLNTFICITSIQIALTDLLEEFGIEADGIIGHSVGELGCAYADKTLTAEQTVLCAYWRGKCIKDANLRPGAMAAVGLTWEDAMNKCPPNVVPACNNSEETQTVSGPFECVKEFADQLKNEGYFVRIVDSSGVAFHSPELMVCSPQFTEKLQRVIKEPKKRSSKWISTAFPEEEWDNQEACYSSAEYHTHNFTHPVLFNAALKMIPNDSIIIEIGPHGLLQSVIKRALGPSAYLTSLMKKNDKDNLGFFMKNLGLLHNIGKNVDTMKLQPKVRLPIGQGTPLISPCIQWNHEIEWPLLKTDLRGGNSVKNSGEIVILSAEELEPLKDHKIDGRLLFPATGYVDILWKRYAGLIGVDKESLSIVIRDFHLHHAVLIPEEGDLEFHVRISASSGVFEINESESLVVNGQIDKYHAPKASFRREGNNLQLSDDDEKFQLTKEDIYKELRVRGYDYGPNFQLVTSSTLNGYTGKILWQNSWITFLDSMLQVHALSSVNRSLKLPTRIRRLVINTDNLAFINNEEINFTFDPLTNTCIAGGVRLIGLQLNVSPRKFDNQQNVLQKYEFVEFKKTVEVHSQLLFYLNSCISMLEGYSTNANRDNGRNVTQDYEYKQESKSKRKMSTINIHYRRQSISKEENIETLKQTIRLFIDKKAIPSRDTLIKSLSDDKLINNLMGERQFKAALDVIFLNKPTNRLRLLYYITESPFNWTFIQRIKNTLKQYATHQFEEIYSGCEKADETSKNSFAQVGWSKDPKSLDIVLVKDYLTCNYDLKAIWEVLKDDGFLFLHETTTKHSILNNLKSILSIPTNGKSFKSLNYSEIISKLESAGWKIIIERYDNIFSSFMVCKKKLPYVPRPIIIPCNDYEQFEWVDKLKSAMEETNKDKNTRVWLIADKDNRNGIVGFLNSLRQEPDGDKVRCLFNANLEDELIPECYLPGGDKFTELLAKDLVFNIFRNGTLGCFCHFHIEDVTSCTDLENAYATAFLRGDLSTLQWVQSKPRPHQCPEKKMVYTHYASLNFRDVMLATGRLSLDAIPGAQQDDDQFLGIEYSGIDESGKRVIGLIDFGGLATNIQIDKRYSWQVPDNWNLKDAATIPVAYATAYYALVVRARIKFGEKILIQSATSAVGQAAIQIAKSFNSIIYTTVGTEEKLQFLMDNFKIPRERISHSRTTQFVDDILQETNGKGVDILLNSLSEEKLQAGIDILAKNGRFLEIGKFDLSQNHKLGMSAFLKNISFHGIVLENLFEDYSIWQEVWQLVKTGLETNIVKPLPTYVFSKNKLEEAFRFMAEGKHIGKILIKLRTESKYSIFQRLCMKDKNFPPESVLVQGYKKTYCNPNKSYIITGGLGGLGLELAGFLIQRGATRIILTSRSGIKNGYQAKLVKHWQKNGCNIIILKENIASLDESKVIFQQAKSLGPIGGIFHLAAVLRDGIFSGQSAESFKAVAETKIKGTLNLDTLSRAECRNSLDWFVVFSSAASGYGNAGQTNYAYANSFMERICEKRRKDGFPAVGIQWGFMGDVGIVVNNLSGNEWYMTGIGVQRVASYLNTLDNILLNNWEILSSIVPVKQRNSSNNDENEDRVHVAISAIYSVLGNNLFTLNCLNSSTVNSIFI
ncbi:DgyrCDS7222 [Dimorphilus gyrociliatus]|uniref:Fatty acid synthase n=1 Tax=Dimorphilus gyrociliatus TaxID=2664684 RepID=A0A7I8VRC7_9ANNE|nr:DgyrCDS7222 [Dimorphilus gyrociliatus]